MAKEIFPVAKRFRDTKNLSFGEAVSIFNNREKIKSLLNADRNSLWFLWGLDPTIGPNKTHPPSKYFSKDEVENNKDTVDQWNFGVVLGTRLRAWIEKKDPWAYDEFIVTEDGESMVEWANSEVPIYLHEHVPTEEHKKLGGLGSKNCPENVARRVLNGEAISCKDLLTYNDLWNKENQIKSNSFAYYYNQELKKYLKNEKSYEKKSSKEMKYPAPNFAKECTKSMLIDDKKENTMSTNEDSKTKKVLIRTLSRRANANVKKLVVNTYVKKFPKGQQSTAIKYIGDFLESEFGDAIVGVLIKNLVKGGQKLLRKY